MTDWNVAINELTALVRQTVREELRPTGVTPGVYSSVTVDELGRVRWGDTGGAGMQFLALARGSPSTFTGTITHNTERVMNMNLVLYDPGSAITTGTAWHYTAPSTGWYMVYMSAHIKPLNASGSTYTSTYDTYVFAEASGGSVYPAEAMQITGIALNSQATDLHLHGMQYCYISAGGTVAAYIGHQAGDGIGTAVYSPGMFAIHKLT